MKHELGESLAVLRHVASLIMAWYPGHYSARNVEDVPKVWSSVCGVGVVEKGGLFSPEVRALILSVARRRLCKMRSEKEQYFLH
jgi:hypothetical protein